MTTHTPAPAQQALLTDDDLRTSSPFQWLARRYTSEVAERMLREFEGIVLSKLRAPVTDEQMLELVETADRQIERINAALASAPAACAHQFHFFGDQKERRCNRCNALESKASAPVAGEAQTPASAEHYDEAKATLQGLHGMMESLSAIERRAGPIGSHARGYTHKITAALRHLDALYAALASAPVAGEAVGVVQPNGDTFRLSRPLPVGTKVYAAPQASAEALEVARAALMEIADLADVEADQRGVIVNQALTKIAKMTVAPQASECECSRKSKAVSDSEAQL